MKGWWLAGVMALALTGCTFSAAPSGSAAESASSAAAAGVQPAQTQAPRQEKTLVYTSGRRLETEQLADGRVVGWKYYSEDGRLLQEIVFDEAGRRLEMNAWNEEGELTARTEYRRNENGVLLEEFSPAIGEKEAVRVTYTLDAAGNAVEKQVFFGEAEEAYQITRMEYDDAGKMVREESAGQVILYEYDAAGNQTVCQYLLEDGAPGSRTEYGFDEAGNRTEERHYRTDGSLEVRLRYAYDEEGRPVRYDQEGSTPDTTLSILYEYDEQGRLCKQTFLNGDGTLSSWVDSRYDGDWKSSVWSYPDGRQNDLGSSRIDEQGRVIETPSAEGDAWSELVYDEQNSSRYIWCERQADGSVLFSEEDGA